MQKYVFRFFQNDVYQGVHIITAETDEGACARARAYLEKSADFDLVEIRGGFRFVQKIEKIKMAQ